MRIAVAKDDAVAILGAMKTIAEIRGAMTDADRVSLISAARWMFNLNAIDVDQLARLSPEQLADKLKSQELRDEASRFIAIMALVEPEIDPEKLKLAVSYGDALGVKSGYVDELVEAASGDLKSAMAHMVRDNMDSVLGHPFVGDVGAWMLPYQGAGADAKLAAKFRALAQLPDGTFGKAFISFYEANDYSVPGETNALNGRFCVPHDSSHVFAGYNTTPRGELLVSTFTAGMHPFHPMSGHILPVIFSWHLGIEINAVAKSAVGGLDPAEFWHAWERGQSMKVDLFGQNWDFWSWADLPISDLRARYLPADRAHRT